MMGVNHVHRRELLLLEPIISLTADEAAWWEKTIRDFRGKLIKQPSFYIQESIKGKDFSREVLSRNVESLLIDERENVYNLFLKAEAELNAQVVAHLIENRPVPKEIFDELVESRIINDGLASFTSDELKSRLAEVIGDYTGKIFPYLYALSLSSTNSRRSRAGSTFEQLMEKALSIYGYPFQNQSHLGKDFFKENRIGKKVDLIIPGKEAYSTRRSNCAIVSVKTSLRERWQEVVEELTRSNVPHIFLATLDEGITHNQLEIMKAYNITLIVRQNQKKEKFPDAGTVESYDTFFNTTVPHLLGAWPGYSND
jgi:hypothetical protein